MLGLERTFYATNPSLAMPTANLTESSAPAGRYLDELNAEQRLAVEHGIGREVQAGEGPLLVIAGAGSGKTSTLAHRVARLVVAGTDPQRILLLTFSRRAAAEMERRAGQVLQRALGGGSRPPPTLPWSGTFHSVGARLLREYAERIGLDPSFTVHDRADSEDLMAIVRHKLGLSATRNRFPGKATCTSIYSRTVNGGAELRDVLSDNFPWCSAWAGDLTKLFAAYVAEKQAQNALDFDDLLLYWAHMVAEPELGSAIGARFDHVLVDEYQDTNHLQAAILLAMKPHGAGLTVVGDDAQSIYSFRAATVRNILDFPRAFDPPARIVTLARNYRSTQAILDASNAVIALAGERHDKNLWSDRSSSRKPGLISVRDETDQARCVADSVLEHRECGLALKSQAVLFRSSSHSAQLELELARRGIPFVKYGGLKFLEAAHVKDVLCVLRWADNPRNRMSGFRIVRLLPGVGPATAAKLLDAMESAAEPVTAIDDFRMPVLAEPDWSALRDLLRALRSSRAEWPADIDWVTHWYEPHLHRIYDDAAARQADLAQLARIASTYPSRERFLTEVTLDPPGATSDEARTPGLDEDYLILSTIHSAKGQEWRSVHVLNVVDGCIPSDLSTGSTAEIDEERRLLYVAMTRARDELQLLVPQRFYVHQQAQYGDRHVYASRSRFIPDRMTALFDCRAWPEAAPPTTGPSPGAAPLPVTDLARRVRVRWQAG